MNAISEKVIPGQKYNNSATSSFCLSSVISEKTTVPFPENEYLDKSTSALWYVYKDSNKSIVFNTTDSNTVAKTYTWGLDLSGQLQGAGGVGGLLSVTAHSETGDSTYYPSYDANGNVSEYVDDSDTVVAHYEYSPFGKLTSSSGSKSADFCHRFSTKYLDSETNLYYYGYRYYSSELGRWLSRDPIEEQGGVNVYVFVGNDGVNAWDVLGMKRVIRAHKKRTRWPPLGQEKFNFKLTLKASDYNAGGGGGAMIYALNYSWTSKADVTYCDCNGRVQTESGTLIKSGTIKEDKSSSLVPILQTRESKAMLLPSPAAALSKMLLSAMGSGFAKIIDGSIDLDANIFIIDGFLRDERALDKLLNTTPKSINKMEWEDLQFVECK